MLIQKTEALFFIALFRKTCTSAWMLNGSLIQGLVWSNVPAIWAVFMEVSAADVSNHANSRSIQLHIRLQSGLRIRSRYHWGHAPERAVNAISTTGPII